MKVLFVFICVLISGCVTGFTSATSGDQSKNGGPMRFERLGALTSQELSTGRQCHSSQVKVCTTSDPREDCGCMSIDAAQRQVQPVVRRHRSDGQR